MPPKLGQNDNKIAKKRGRKAKKDADEPSENIVVVIEEKDDEEENVEESEETNTANEYNHEEDNKENNNDEDKPLAKKRGRKPKGGKIIQQITYSPNAPETKPNVILHLKCSLKDLTASSLFDADLDGFSFSQSNMFLDALGHDASATHPQQALDGDGLSDYNPDHHKQKDGDIREIWKKLKILEHNLHVNNTDNKKSACFWDTCEFDNPPVYIPKHFLNDTYQVYGCFCSPECAVAHLMEENIDSSVRFERYQLMNHIYSKVYNYTKNIKPAPNPYYMLEKYCGNLSIQEYRALLSNERLFLVVDKPLTRVMPELHEDNDDFIINNKIIPTNNVKVRKLQKKQTKTNILSERFGFSQT